MLREHVQDYNKGVEFSRFENGVNSAKERAKRLCDDAALAGEPRRNPTTSVYRLLESMAKGTDDQL